MKSVHQPVFIAFDEMAFLTEKECLAYEDGHWQKLLVGMTLEQVEAALDRTDIERANAFERAARPIAKLRVAAGERLRAPKNAAANEPADAASEQPAVGNAGDGYGD